MAELKLKMAKLNLEKSDQFFQVMHENNIIPGKFAENLQSWQE